MMMLRPAEIIFWTAFACVAYTYAGYPGLIWLLARCFGRPAAPPNGAGGELPALSLLIVAHNEAAIIGQRLENALALDYPPDKLEICVASDGSEDTTAAVVRGYAARGVRLFDYPDRRGKASALNSTIAALGGRIVMLSDANTFTDPAAARALVRWFADWEIGVVCGRLILTDRADGANADGLYWRYETFLKRCESRLGALLGSNGAIYAMRRELWTAIPPGTIVDDLVAPLLVRQRTGCRLIYDRDAVAFEDSGRNVSAEFRRRARIGAGGFQAIGMLWRLIDPRQGWIAFSFVSHKVMRWICPFFLVAMLASAAALAGLEFYLWIFGLQCAFYCVSLLGGFLPRIRMLKPLRLGVMFTGMNLALLLGFWRWLAGRQGAMWQPTAR